MVYTVRLAGHGRQGGRNAFEQQLHDWNITQKNSRPNHPTTCGKVERFQQTLKKWLRAQPHQPATLHELQQLLDQFRNDYNNTRPHRSLPHRAPPATLYNTMPKDLPRPSRDPNTHDRIRHDRIGTSGTVTLRTHGKLRHIGIGRTHAGTHAGACPQRQPRIDTRPHATARGYDGRWQRIRAIKRARDPLCEWCKEAGRVVIAELVDHYIPLAAGGTHADENLVSMCRPCHGLKTEQDKRKYTQVYQTTTHGRR